MHERFKGVGTIHIGMTVKNARIDEIQLSGHFFGVNDIKEIEQALKGVKLRKEDIEEALSEIDVSNFIARIETDQFIKFLLEIPE